QTVNYQNLVKEYVQLRDQREQIDQAMDGIKEQLRGLDAGTHTIAGLQVVIAPNRRLDETRVTTLYPVSSHPELYTAKPDPKKLREELPPKVVDSLMREAGPARVTVK